MKAIVNPRKQIVPKKKKSKYKRMEEFKDFLTVLPAIILLGIFVYYPLSQLFKISFTNWNLIRDGYDYVGFKNFKWLFTGSGWPELLNSFKVTIIYTIAELSITLIGGFLLALLFNKTSKSFAVMRTIVFMPKYIAMSTAGIIYLWILHYNHGILNHLLNILGFSSVNWLGKTNTALIGVLFLTQWKTVGFAMIIYLSAMRNIPETYYEAASLDGASYLQKLRYITIPLLSPTTLFLFVTTFISSMKIFQSIDVMTGGGPYKATNVIVYWIYNLAFVEFRVDKAAAVSVIFFIVLLACTIATLKYSDKSVNYDA